MDELMDVRVRFAVDDQALSDLHSRAFGYAATSVESWTQRLQRHSLTWIGAFDRGSLVGFVHACWDGGSHAFALDTSTPTTSDGASAAPSCRPSPRKQQPLGVSGCTSTTSLTWTCSTVVTAVSGQLTPDCST